MDLREQGNQLFRGGKHEEAAAKYTEALKSRAVETSSKATILTNRAACYLKLKQYEKCVSDCTDALQLDSSLVKALYRRAIALEQLSDFNASFEDLTKLIKIDPTNADAVDSARRVKETLLSQRKEQTEVQKWLKVLAEDKARTKEALVALIEMCSDNTSSALDFGRKAGLSLLINVLNEHCALEESKLSSEIIIRALRLMLALTSNKPFLSQFYRTDGFMDNNNPARFQLSLDGHLSIQLLCNLLQWGYERMEYLTPVVATLVNVLKFTPVSDELSDPTKKMQIQENIIKVDDSINFSFPIEEIRRIMSTASEILAHQDPESHSLMADFLGALISSNLNFFDPNEDVDVRTESLQDRRYRHRVERVTTARVETFCRILVGTGVFSVLANGLVAASIAVRRSTSSLLGKLIKQYGREDHVKELLLPFLPGEDEPLADSTGESKIVEVLPVLEGSLQDYLRRAALEAALLSTNPELGAWALQQRGGAANIIRLVSLGDPACTEIAAEVICLASSVESLSALMTFLVERGVLHSLVSSTIPGVCAAAASAMTKLAIKSKALERNSDENSLILNAVLSVVRSSTSQQPPKLPSSQNALVSFSAHDNAAHTKTEADNGQRKSTQVVAASHATTMTSVERSIEVLAAMVGHSFVKEELVHGSFRVAPCMKEILSLEIDPRSTLGFGIAHIVSQLTVTNKELKAIALAEKEISVEQYEQLQELQRIKTTDDQGNNIEEKKEEADFDNSELCKQRIRKLVSCGAIKCLVKLAGHVSVSTREKAIMSLRQICGDERSRGAFIQEGGFKICCEANTKESESPTARREAAHAVAKSLVTTNPHVLSEHQRLGAMRPLLYLCKESGTSQLQQFEALLALTNILSCGETEQNRFVAEKGIHAVHYLMFSSNLMVRRAATEAFCNMSVNEDFLKLLRDGEKLRLWLAFVEDWDPSVDDNKEKFLTARAALGTLAGTSSDEDVVKAMVVEDCGRTIRHVLEVANEELLHRLLVVISEMLSHESAKDVANYLAQQNLIPALSITTKFNNPALHEILVSIVESMTSLLSST